MMHYSHRVVNLFCVIDNAKSPWKTIHLPRVLQSAGELSFGCPTTRIRDALKNSLLSISAFCLSNDYRSNRREKEASSWANIASRYRCDAIGLLKYAVETNLYAGERPKYKEFLATMLSMITINVRRIPLSQLKLVLTSFHRSCQATQVPVVSIWMVPRSL
jgi:arginine metabolism regulation protein II